MCGSCGEREYCRGLLAVVYRLSSVGSRRCTNQGAIAISCKSSMTSSSSFYLIRTGLFNTFLIIGILYVNTNAQYKQYGMFQYIVVHLCFSGRFLCAHKVKSTRVQFSGCCVLDHLLRFIIVEISP